MRLWNRSIGLTHENFVIYSRSRHNQLLLFALKGIMEYFPQNVDKDRPCPFFLKKNVHAPHLLKHRRQAALHRYFTKWLTCDMTNGWHDPPGIQQIYCQFRWIAMFLNLLEWGAPWKGTEYLNYKYLKTTVWYLFQIYFIYKAVTKEVHSRWFPCAPH